MEKSFLVVCIGKAWYRVSWNREVFCGMVDDESKVLEVEYFEDFAGRVGSKV